MDYPTLYCIFNDPELTLTEVKVLGAVCSYANTDSGNKAWPSHDKIAARACGLSRWTISRTLGSLVDKGWLIRKQRRYHSSELWITVPDRMLDYHSRLRNHDNPENPGLRDHDNQDCGNSATTIAQGGQTELYKELSNEQSNTYIVPVDHGDPKVVNLDQAKKNPKRPRKKPLKSTPVSKLPETEWTSGEVPYRLICELYNELCPEMEFCAVLNEDRKRAIDRNWNSSEDDMTVGRDRDNWIAYFKLAARNPFNNGENDRGWRASLDYLLREKTFTRIYEDFLRRQRKHNRENGRNHHA